MTSPLYCVYGAGGAGRDIMPLARAELQRQGIPISQLVFVDDQADQEIINGHRVLRYEEFLKEEASERYVSLAFADGTLRERMALKCTADGIKPWTVVSSTVVSLDGVTMGEGAILCPFVAITSNVSIGRYFYANIHSYLAHDSIVGDFVTFAGAVHSHGRVIYEDYVYVGGGACIKQGTSEKPLVIGRGAFIGMGSVVTRDVPPGATVGGNPARVLPKREPVNDVVLEKV